MSDKLVTPGKNTAVFNREAVAQDTARAKRSNYWLERAGKAIEPTGCTYIGSAAIHYFEVRSPDDKVRHATVSQILIEKVAEQFADWGHKELKKSLMQAYGREVKS